MNDPIYTLAYPTLSDADREMIERVRALHDKSNLDVVAPHFTLAFGAKGLDLGTYIEHVSTIAATIARLSFTCRYAMLGADDQSETAYVFLVPDDGFGAISRLHDVLYTGLLGPHLRLDLPYVPHITIGTLTGRPQAKAICDELNASRIDIPGSLDEITVSMLEAGRIRDVATFALGVSASHRHL